MYEAPYDEDIVSRRSITGGGDAVRLRCGSDSVRFRGADPDLEMNEPFDGEGGMGRTLASSSATRPASLKDSLAVLPSSAIEMRGRRAAWEDSDASDGVRERVNTLIDGARLPESSVDAG